jgi:HSP20 family protein
MTTTRVPLTTFDRLAASFFGPNRPLLPRQIPVDAVQREDRLVLRFDLPGVAEDAIDITVERRTLTVKAARPTDLREGDRVFLAERPWGEWSRQVVLGEALDTERVSASYTHGVLTVTVPVAQTARSRKIEIGHAPVEAVSGPDASIEVQSAS